jgi:hypothetical protein
MKNIILRSIAMIALAVPMGACHSTVIGKAQRSDGLLDFLFDNSSDVPVRVEKISGGGGRIVSARVRNHGGNVYVSGWVQRQSPASPPPWAHVDVIVVDARSNVVESVVVKYMPRDIPHGIRGEFPRSNFRARLSALPQKNATVRAVFHSAATSECEILKKHSTSVFREQG